MCLVTGLAASSEVNNSHGDISDDKEGFSGDKYDDEDFQEGFSGDKSDDEARNETKLTMTTFRWTLIFVWLSGSDDVSLTVRFT